MGKFQLGDPKLPNAGRKEGSLNKMTVSIKEAILTAFNELQRDPNANLVAWGKANTTAFYMVASKVIPTEINHSLDNKVINVVSSPLPPSDIQEATVIE